MRAGVFTLTLLGSPRVFLILRSLAGGRKGQLGLRRDTGSPAQSTLRGHLSTLEEIGAVTRAQRDTFPGALEYELTEAGRELLAVGDAIGVWLDNAPRGPLELGTDAGKAAIKGLVEGWSAGVIPALASAPLSLTELDRLIAPLSYPTIERCLLTMRLAEQVDTGKRSARGTPYALTGWTRRGLAPLAVAARWESRSRPDDAAAVDRGDIEDAVAIGKPLFDIADDESGVCRLELKSPRGTKGGTGIAHIHLRDGEIGFGEADPQDEPDARASGPATAWFSAILDADATGLRLTGDEALAVAVLDGVHNPLFESLLQK